MRFADPRTYFLSMGAYWVVFGLITTFYVRIMDLFQTSEGVAAGTAFSDHVWFHHSTVTLAARCGVADVEDPAAGGVGSVALHVILRADHVAL